MLHCSKGGGIIHADSSFTQRIEDDGSKHYCSHCASSLAGSPPQKCVSCSNILKGGVGVIILVVMVEICASSCVQAFEVSVFGMEEEETC